MTKFRGKYRITSTRLKNWDYGSNAIYFVTICTKNSQHFFGEIMDGKMNLSEIGIMADKYWLEIPEHFPFVILHNHIVMPNHVHGLIEIAKNDITTNDVDDHTNVETQNLASLSPSSSPSSSSSSSSSPSSSSPSSLPPSSLPPSSLSSSSLSSSSPSSSPPPPILIKPTISTESIYKNQFGPQSKNLSSIIRGFKIGVTKNARMIQPDFQWQSRFHDHIVRNDQSFHRISNYITNNPKQWDQ